MKKTKFFLLLYIFIIFLQFATFPSYSFAGNNSITLANTTTHIATSNTNITTNNTNVANNNNTTTGHTSTNNTSITNSNTNNNNNNNTTNTTNTNTTTTNNNANINIYSPSCILIEKNSGKVLYEKNANTVRYPASTTKIMTAILAVENCKLDDIATVSHEAIFTVPVSYSHASLKEGEELTIEQLLNVLMIPSANDAANVLAEHISGSVDKFSDLMNEKAKEIGCLNTHFVNPNRRS